MELFWIEIQMKIYLLCSIGGMICGFLIALLIFGKTGNRPGNQTVTLIHSDTVFIIKPAEPLIITRIKAKITPVRDTLILTQPFIAAVDTIINDDTLTAGYEYPDNVFSIDLRRKPDSVMVRTVTINTPTIKKRAWWEVPVYVAGGVLAGYFFGSISR